MRRVAVVLLAALAVLSEPSLAGSAVTASRESFTGADGTPLAAHSGEAAAAWTKHPLYPADLTLHGGRVHGRHWGMYTASGVPPGAEYDVSADLHVQSNLGSTGVVARAHPAVDSFYIGRYNAAPGRWELLRCEVECSLLGGHHQALRVGATHALRLEIRDAAKRLYVDGVERISSTNNDILRAGRAGVRQGHADASPTTGYHLDNFLVRAPADLVWDADAEQAADEEWASSASHRLGLAPGHPQCASAPPDLVTPRLTRTPAVAAQGAFAYRSEVVDGDDCFDERAELGQGNPTRPGFENRLFSEGDERYISWQVLLPTDFDVDVTTWQVIAQWKQLGALGTPALSMAVESGEFRLYKSDSNGDTNDSVLLWSAAAAKNRWVKFTLRVKFSPDPDVGFVELWGNPAGGSIVKLLPETDTYTMKRDGRGNPVKSHSRIGIYRDSAISGNAHLFYDGYTVATTRDAAEANAF